jgi:hypothetical protein
LKSGSEKSESFFKNEKIKSTESNLNLKSELEQSHKRKMTENLDSLCQNDKVHKKIPLVKYDEIYIQKPTDEKKEKIIIKQTFDPSIVDKIFNDLLLNFIIEKNNLDFDQKSTEKLSLKIEKNSLANEKSGEIIKQDDQRWDPISNEPKSVNKEKKKESINKPTLRVSWGE